MANFLLAALATISMEWNSFAGYVWYLWYKVLYSSIWERIWPS